MIFLFFCYNGLSIMEDRMERKLDYRKLIGAPILILFLAACAPQQSTLIAPASPPATITDFLPPAATPAPAEPTPTATVVQPPEPAGSGWLLVNTKQGLWAANPDGSGATYLTDGRILVPGRLAEAVSPAGAHVAYLTTTDWNQPYGNYPNLKINILDLTLHAPLVTLPLTSPQTEPGADSPSDITRAMVEMKSYAWSPEGGRLAYIGAAQGPSTDVYEYMLGTGETLRLTDGADQAYDPLWSPDGKWVVHAAAAGFGTGAGIGITGFYAARADDGAVISLYGIPEHSGGEQAIGWLDDHTLVAHSWFATCGPSDLRLVDLSTQKADLVFDGCLSAASVGAGGVLLAQSPDTGRFDESPRPGLYLLTAFNRTPRLIGNHDIREAVWMPAAGAFLARTQDSRLLNISLDGEIRALEVSVPFLPTVAPGGLAWAYSASGIFAGEYGKEPARIFDGEVAPGQMLFSPTGNALYFLDAAGNLYRADAPDWAPALLASGLTPASSWWLSMAWMRGE
jgi:hypothetical protein